MSGSFNSPTPFYTYYAIKARTEDEREKKIRQSNKKKADDQN